MNNAIDHILPATESDADAVARLVNAAYRPGPGAETWTHESDLIDGDRTSKQQVLALVQQKDAIVLLGMKHEGIVACALIEKSGDYCHIGMLAVRPELQASGLGKRMLAEAEHHSVIHFAAKRLRIEVVAARQELIAFYLRRGYHSTGDSFDYPHDSGVGIPKQPEVRVETLEKAAPNAHS